MNHLFFIIKVRINERRTTEKYVLRHVFQCDIHFEREQSEIRKHFEIQTSANIESPILESKEINCVKSTDKKDNCIKKQKNKIKLKVINKQEIIKS